MPQYKTFNFEIEGGKATGGHPIGPALNPLGVNVMEIVRKIKEGTEVEIVWGPFKGRLLGAYLGSRGKLPQVIAPNIAVDRIINDNAAVDGTPISISYSFVT